MFFLIFNLPIAADSHLASFEHTISCWLVWTEIVLWPNSPMPINQFKPVQQSRQQTLRAYSPNIYLLRMHASSKWRRPFEHKTNGGHYELGILKYM